MFYFYLVSSILLKVNDQYYELQTNLFTSASFTRAGFNNSLYYDCSVGQCRFKWNDTIQGIYISSVDNSIYKMRELDGDIVIDNLTSLYSLSFTNPNFSALNCNIQLYLDIPMDVYELINMLTLFNINLNIVFTQFVTSSSILPGDPKTISILISNNSTLLNTARILTVSGSDVYLIGFQILSILQANSNVFFRSAVTTISTSILAPSIIKTSSTEIGISSSIIFSKMGELSISIFSTLSTIATTKTVLASAFKSLTLQSTRLYVNSTSLALSQGITKSSSSLNATSNPTISQNISVNTLLSSNATNIFYLTPKDDENKLKTRLSSQTLPEYSKAPFSSSRYIIATIITILILV